MLNLHSKKKNLPWFLWLCGKKNCNLCTVDGVFGTVDHLVNNAGILQLRLFEDFSQLSDIASVMVIRP